MKRLTIIGSTGSVGRNTLEVVKHLDGRLKVFALGAHSSVDTLAEQVSEHRPEIVAIADSRSVAPFVKACGERGLSVPELFTGTEGLARLAALGEADVVVSAAVGAAGLEPTYSALAAGHTVALANKEAMVLAGELLRKTAAGSGGVILPVDSEHNAIDQCLRAGSGSEVGRLILTASGGPFLDRPASDFVSVTQAEALDHPTWKMGPRITIDSATLMNKGLEVIEARWLFGINATSIDIVVHPQSIIHSMVEFVDGSVIAQMGTADMRGPIQYALTYPDRVGSSIETLDWSAIPALEFRVPDRQKFPCLPLAYRALDMGGTAPAALNAADEVAVEAFLAKRVTFTEIPRIIERVLDEHDPTPADSVGAILEADRSAREIARARTTMA